MLWGCLQKLEVHGRDINVITLLMLRDVKPMFLLDYELYL
jgi:hypothetical protein